MPKDGCLFCTVLAEDDDEANLILYRGERVAVMLNKYPYTNGHLMLLPVEHVASLAAASTRALAELMQLAQACERVLREAYGPEGFNMGINIGSAAGAGIPDHVHAHLLPRWEGDTNFMTTVAGMRIIPEDLSVTYRRLQELLLKHL